MLLILIGSLSFLLFSKYKQVNEDAIVTSSSNSSLLVSSSSKSSKITEAKITKFFSSESSVSDLSISSLDLDVVISSSSSSVIPKKTIPSNMVEVKLKDSSKLFDTCQKNGANIELGYTETSCFRLKFDSNSLFKTESNSDNLNLINNSPENKDLLTDLASDYYTKIEKKVKSRVEPVVISNATKKGDFQFEFDLEIQSKCKAKYLLFLSNGKWEYKNNTADLVNCRF